MIPWADLKRALCADAEFQHTIRYWTATVRVSVGAVHRALRFEDGTLTDVRECVADEPCDVFVAGPESDWSELLRPVPRPFYQDLAFAVAHHDLEMSRDTEVFAAYYPALRRLVEVLRDLRSEAAAEGA